MEEPHRKAVHLQELAPAARHPDVPSPRQCLAGRVDRAFVHSGQHTAELGKRGLHLALKLTHESPAMRSLLRRWNSLKMRQKDRRRTLSGFSATLSSMVMFR
jgi:hypothetical protein